MCIPFLLYKEQTNIEEPHVLIKIMKKLMTTKANKGKEKSLSFKAVYRKKGAKRKEKNSIELEHTMQRDKNSL